MKRTQQAFTLIEVMIALLLMTLMSLIAWRGLDSVQRTDTRLQAVEQDRAQLLRVLNQLDRDLALRVTTELDSPPLPPATAASRPHAQVVRLAGSPGNPRLDILRSAPAEDGALQQVRWWLQGGVLYRATSAPRAALQPGELQPGVAVLDQVAAWQLRSWHAGKGWGDWQAGTADNPQALELTLVRNGEAGQARYRLVLGPLAD